MVEGNYGFCQRCGAKVDPGAMYCPECGRPMFEPPPEVVAQQRVAYAERTISTRITWILILVGVYAFMSILDGISSIFLSDMAVDMAKSIYPDFIKTIESLGMTESEYIEMNIKLGAVTLVSGILAAIAFIPCVLRRRYKVAVAFCIGSALSLIAEFFFMNPKMLASSILSVTLQVSIGLLVAYMIYQCRVLFDKM